MYIKASSDAFFVLLIIYFKGEKDNEKIISMFTIDYLPN